MPSPTDDVPLLADAAVAVDFSQPADDTMTHKLTSRTPPASSTPPLSSPPLSPTSAVAAPLLPSVPSDLKMIMFPGADPGEYISRRRARQLIHVRLAYGWLSFRVLLLCCICCITFGTYWIHDAPAALYTQFQGWFGEGFTNASNANLYAVYSYPNVILPFVCGILVDKYLGVRWGTILFVSLSTTGELMFCMGVSMRSYTVALLGRLVIGLGAESLSVMQGIYMIKWYEGPRLALVFGLVTVPLRLGSSFSLVATPYLAAYSVPTAVWFGFVIMLGSFFFCLSVCALDWYADKQLTGALAHHASLLTEEQREFIRMNDEASKSDEQNNSVSLADIRAMPTQLWLLCVICACTYVSVLTFGSIAQDVLVNTGNHYDPVTADLYMSVEGFVCVVAAPIAGWALDRTGRALFWIVVALGILMCGHLCILALVYEVPLSLSLGPVPILFLNGLGYSAAAAALWPILAYILTPQQIASGYGAVNSANNLGLATAPQIISRLRGIQGVSGTRLEYGLAMMSFVGVTVFGGMMVLVLMVVDQVNGGRINQTGKERAAREKAEGSLATLKAEASSKQPSSGPNGHTDEGITVYEEQKEEPLLSKEKLR